jgi:hypothetical protein
MVVILVENCGLTFKTQEMILTIARLALGYVARFHRNRPIPSSAPRHPDKWISTRNMD